MFADRRIPGIRAGAGRSEVLTMHAVARLVLNRDIPNIQASWVKEGLPLGQACLESGANDFGGTLMNESISTAAGAPHGQSVRPRDLRRCIREVGRIPALRSTLYAILRRFPDERRDGEDPLDKLDAHQKTPSAPITSSLSRNGFGSARGTAPQTPNPHF